MDTADTVYVTADDAVMLVREKTGIPFTRSRLHKDSMRGIAPKPAAVYGNRYLWRPEDVLRYAKTLVKAPPEATP